MATDIAVRFRSAALFAMTCLAAVYVLTATAGAETPGDVLVIETIGTGPAGKGDSAAAEQQAVRNALDMAVEEALKTIVPPDVLADHAREIGALFHGKAEDYVLNYTKLAVTEEDDYCRVQVRASIPDGGIRDRLRRSGITPAVEQRHDSPHGFQIRIRGTGYLAGLHIFRDMLNGMDGISRPQLHEMTMDEAVMSVDFSGSSRELAQTLAGARSDLLAVTVTDVREDGVEITLRRADVPGMENQSRREGK